MADRRNTMRSVVLAVATLTLALLVGVYAVLSYTGRPVGEEESLEIARDFLRNSPTFRFDGMEETLRHAETLQFESPHRWEFVFTFDSQHAGYGDRTGQTLAQVITPHTAHIVVEKGRVVSATLDGQWDMIRQEMISGQSSRHEAVAV